MKWIKRFLLLTFLVIFIGVGTLGYFGYREYQKAVDEKPLDQLVTEIREKDHYVTYEEISPYLLKATVAVEDKRFFTHGGIDYIATCRAILSNLVSDGIVSGGSTITQQLAKNLYFGYEPSVLRKIAEVFVAKDLENQYTKKEILELYVNVINYGDNHIGIGEAAHGYFGISAWNLNIDQSSLLAGIPQSPANYQLSNHEDVARKRQKVVVKAMKRDEVITNQQYQDLMRQITKVEE